MIALAAVAGEKISAMGWLLVSECHDRVLRAATARDVSDLSDVSE